MYRLQGSVSPVEFARMKHRDGNVPVFRGMWQKQFLGIIWIRFISGMTSWLMQICAPPARSWSSINGSKNRN